MRGPSPPSPKDFQPRPIKALFQRNSVWTDLLETYPLRENARQTAKYLGRYLKKPPVAGNRLAHYDGGSRVTLRFLDHRTEQYSTLELSQRELILRLIKHIPEKHFRMIRYFGFLANRVVGEKLPQVRKALGQEDVPRVKKVTFAGLSQALLNTEVSCPFPPKVPPHANITLNLIKKIVFYCYFYFNQILLGTDI